MKLGIFNANTLYKGTDGYTTDGTVVKLYEHWEPHFDQIDLCSPVVTGGGEGHHGVNQSLNVIQLRQWRNPWTLRTFELPILLRDIWTVFREHSREWDFVLIPTTNIFGQAVFAVARMFDVPVLIYLRGNVAKEIQSGHEGLTRLIAVSWTRILQFGKYHMLQNRAILTAGRELEEKHSSRAGSIEAIVPSLVEAKDVVNPEVRRYPGEDEPMKILYLGRLVKYKRIQDVFHALMDLQSCPRTYEFEIVGAGSYREELERHAKVLGVMDSVNFTGHVSIENVFEFYDDADIFVLPSETEGSPKSVPEAMARGCPIVATDVGNLPRLLDEQTGVTYTPGNVDALTEALERLGTDEDCWYTLVENSLDRAKQFTIESQVSAIRRVLSSAYPDEFGK